MGPFHKQDKLRTCSLILTNIYGYRKAIAIRVSFAAIIALQNADGKNLLEGPG